MAGIRGNNLKPETTLETCLREKEILFTRNDKRLPGSPDFGFYHAADFEYFLVVFVHGCFWHGCRKHYKCPKSNVEFWKKKLKGNRARDRRNRRDLQAWDIEVVTVWECQLRKRTLVRTINRVAKRLEKHYAAKA